jgi:energy-coupling factor transporter transmembrane protein EcfT
MTHRYIFLFIETANQMFESRQSRIMGRLPRAEQRHIAARTVGVLLNRSIDLSNEVYLAMQSRGFRGEIRTLSEFQLRAWDYAGLAAFLCAGGAAIWAGR